VKVNANWSPGITIGVGILAGFVKYPELPEALQQSALPPALMPPLVAFGLPVAALVTYLILRKLWGEPFERAIDAEAEAIHRGIAMRLVVFIIALHMLVLLNLGGAQWIHAWGPRLVVVLFGGVFIAIGNLLPRTRPNLALGIRTTRTLTDRQLWIRLHRTCGYVAVALGTIIVISGLFLHGPALGSVVGAAALGSIATLVAMYHKQCRA
jgi:immunity protein, SdpI family